MRRYGVTEEIRDGAVQAGHDPRHEARIRGSSLAGLVTPGRGGVGDGWGTVVGMEHLESLGWVEDGEGDAQLCWNVCEGVVVGGANEGVIPLNYLFDHVQLVVMVIRGGVAPPSHGKRMSGPVRKGR